jgi:predicted MPP superfamily phosphohydrolase
LATALPTATSSRDGRHLIVSGGLGCSIMPVRFGMPPEITLLELG